MEGEVTFGNVFAVDGFEGWQRVFLFKMKAQKKVCPKEEWQS